MKKTLALILVLYSAGAFAQSGPPAAGTKSAALEKPRGGGPKSVAEKMQECLKIDDGTKGRLDCYDAAVSPKPKPNPPTAKGVMDCRFIKEEDDRLDCFNGFAAMIPKFSR